MDSMDSIDDAMDDRDLELEERLRAAAERLDPVPAELFEEAMRAYALRSLDAELAELTFDSWDELSATRVRGGGRARLLTFAAGEVVVELEVSGGRLVGRLSGGGPADIVLQRRDGGTRVRADELGRFTTGELAPGPLRLRVSPEGGGPVVTTWILL
ncbi:carboxypeptidase-like regulatory domain-containing protein [Nonomuraea sp. NPDC050786]|uniref:carboxypeptidase-like regulatory domain-containing protein n=1 Tax=Nonomuraea sp. NPDC050786 TaxID=3154840 RepID=UPI0034075B31